MDAPLETCYTIEDIYALPEGQRAELIDGQLYNMAPPNAGHQENPMNRIVNVYDLKHDEKTELYSFDDIIPACIFEDFRIRFPTFWNNCR